MGRVCRMEDFRSAFKILTDKPTTNRFKLRCADNIRKDLKEISVNVNKWIDWSQDRDYWRSSVNEALNFGIP
jgi:hypothetical protein